MESLDWRHGLSMSPSGSIYGHNRGLVFGPGTSPSCRGSEKTAKIVGLEVGAPESRAGGINLPARHIYRRLEVDLNTGALGAGTARPLLFATGFAAALGVLARFQVAHLDVLALFFLSHLIFLSLVVDWVGRGL